MYSVSNIKVYLIHLALKTAHVQQKNNKKIFVEKSKLEETFYKVIAANNKLSTMNFGK